MLESARHGGCDAACTGLIQLDGVNAITSELGSSLVGEGDGQDPHQQDIEGNHMPVTHYIIRRILTRGSRRW